jgi:hypothetical protein
LLCEAKQPQVEVLKVVNRDVPAYAFFFSRQQLKARR